MRRALATALIGISAVACAPAPLTCTAAAGPLDESTWLSEQGPVAYHSLTWTNASGTVLGYSAYEDSTIWAELACAQAER